MRLRSETAKNLRALAALDDPMLTRDLVAVMGMKPDGARLAIHRMHERGLVDRIKYTAKVNGMNRAYLYQISAAGRRELADYEWRRAVTKQTAAPAKRPPRVLVNSVFSLGLAV